MRIRDVSGERLQLAQAARSIRSSRGRSRRAPPRARSRRHAGMDARRRRQDRLVQYSLRPRRRRARRPGGDRQGRRTVRSGGAPRSGGGGQGDRRLEAPRVGGRRRRAPDLRRRRGAHGGRLRRRRPRCFRNRGAQGGDGAQRGRLFAHDRSAVDRGRDLRQVQAADLLQRRLPADLVARAGLPRSGADRRRNPRSAARQAAAARAGRLSAPGRRSN